MTTFIFSVTLLNNNNNIEYKTIQGVFGNVEDAKESALNMIKMQSKFWEGSYTKNIGRGKVALVNGPEEFSKIYHIQEMEVK